MGHYRGIDVVTKVTKHAAEFAEVEGVGSLSTRRICIINANNEGLPVHKCAPDAHAPITTGFINVLRKDLWLYDRKKKYS